MRFSPGRVGEKSTIMKRMWWVLFCLVFPGSALCQPANDIDTLLPLVLIAPEARQVPLPVIDKCWPEIEFCKERFSPFELSDEELRKPQPTLPPPTPPPLP
jgi:hypothetical protein